MSAADAIRESRLVAILRSDDTTRLTAAAEVLADEGIRTIEFPLTRPETLHVISTTAARLGTDIHVGAGTVRTIDDARRAIDAGATFLVAPGLSLPVVEYAQQRGVTMLPGVFTPSEADHAAQARAELVKLFPASSHNPEFLRQIRAPLPDVGVMATGGVTLEDAQAWLDAGAAALGIGSPLLGDSLTTGDFDGVRDAARTWRALAAQNAR
ncbi:bifunctional 4-hydroxy-2-oxoglutarate aldolase/2-dehydro-3-deoxy-phosphogluconate aldolase [Myceligenerans salitolerans]|uniref:Bifunctional 4-hydroxy-2-oxoglutarate aldolase/2-dehydro-3-deoxy-phosphogluconate aldolase n=1 Tax=Myceligenerans salitolerans TaxID=1230528 RepID=A0ABS3IDK1_9MICO|nr:bifunctional 4-hydroxy-2-oxoglutarate aldolase/2-dehydro-3-deoxy-phosphogluconate aldolase [Myceligenerans salitolerans]MBO0611107.1 bifunctional 4-hydroxy-2-oxoglutarate aldolase/2-dehydro-3-deoxy-phosphogluconate aldolase [Myceligenerans salitolerans]